MKFRHFNESEEISSCIWNKSIELSYVTEFIHPLGINFLCIHIMFYSLLCVKTQADDMTADAYLLIYSEALLEKEVPEPFFMCYILLSIFLCPLKSVPFKNTDIYLYAPKG